MMIEFILGLKVFLFVFCLLNILKNLYNFVKVLRTKEGKVVSSTSSEILFGLSLSYVITMLIIGF